MRLAPARLDAGPNTGCIFTMRPVGCAQPARFQQLYALVRTLRVGKPSRTVDILTLHVMLLLFPLSDLIDLVLG